MSTGNPAQSRRRVQRAFKMRGLAVQAPALDAMLNVLQRESAQSSQDVLVGILDEIKERLMSSDRAGGGRGGGGDGGGIGGGSQQLVVTKSLLADVVADLSRDGDDVTDEALQLLDAFRTPRLAYDSMRKQFTLMTDRMEKRSLYAEAIRKVCMRGSGGVVSVGGGQAQLYPSTVIVLLIFSYHTIVSCYSYYGALSSLSYRSKCLPNGTPWSSNAYSSRTYSVPS